MEVSTRRPKDVLSFVSATGNYANSNLGDERVTQLMNTLSDPQSSKDVPPRRLDLQCNSLTEQCVPSLCAYLRRSRNSEGVVALSLQWNKINTRNGLMQLGQGLAASTTVHECDLRNNCVDHSAFMSLLAGLWLGKDYTLRALDLRWNSVGDVGATELLSLLNRRCQSTTDGSRDGVCFCPALSKVQLSGNGVSRHLIAEINTALQDRACLHCQRQLAEAGPLLAISALPALESKETTTTTTTTAGSAPLSSHNTMSFPSHDERKALSPPPADESQASSPADARSKSRLAAELRSERDATRRELRQAQRRIVHLQRQVARAGAQASSTRAAYDEKLYAKNELSAQLNVQMRRTQEELKAVRGALRESQARVTDLTERMALEEAAHSRQVKLWRQREEQAALNGQNATALLEKELQRAQEASSRRENEWKAVLAERAQERQRLRDQMQTELKTSQDEISRVHEQHRLELQTVRKAHREALDAQNEEMVKREKHCMQLEAENSQLRQASMSARLAREQELASITRKIADEADTRLRSRISDMERQLEALGHARDELKSRADQREKEQEQLLSVVRQETQEYKRSWEAERTARAQQEQSLTTAQTQVATLTQQLDVARINNTRLTAAAEAAKAAKLSVQQLHKQTLAQAQQAHAEEMNKTQVLLAQREASISQLSGSLRQAQQVIARLRNAQNRRTEAVTAALTGLKSTLTHIVEASVLDQEIGAVSGVLEDRPSRVSSTAPVDLAFLTGLPDEPDRLAGLTGPSGGVVRPTPSLLHNPTHMQPAPHTSTHPATDTHTPDTAHTSPPVSTGRTSPLPVLPKSGGRVSPVTAATGAPLRRPGLPAPSVHILSPHNGSQAPVHDEDGPILRAEHRSPEASGVSPGASGRVEVVDSERNAVGSSLPSRHTGASSLSHVSPRAGRKISLAPLSRGGDLHTGQATSSSPSRSPTRYSLNAAAHTSPTTARGMQAEDSMLDSSPLSPLDGPRDQSLLETRYGRSSTSSPEKATDLTAVLSPRSGGGDRFTDESFDGGSHSAALNVGNLSDLSSLGGGTNESPESPAMSGRARPAPRRQYERDRMVSDPSVLIRHGHAGAVTSGDARSGFSRPSTASARASSWSTIGTGSSSMHGGGVVSSMHGGMQQSSPTQSRYPALQYGHDTRVGSEYVGRRAVHNGNDGDVSSSEDSLSPLD